MKKHPTAHTLDVIMPCFNEEASLEAAVGDALTEFERVQLQGRLIIVDDGSNDRTQEIGRRLAAENDRIIYKRNERNLGIGGAYWEGCKLASSDAVVMIPGDNENSVYEATKFLDLLDRVDIVIPFAQNQEIRHRIRRVISSTYRWIINLSFGTSLNYTNGTVIYRRCALQSVDLSASGFFYQTELLVKLLRRGFLYAEVPQILSKRGSGKSTALRFRSLTTLVISFSKLFFQVHIKRVEGRRTPVHLLPDGTATKEILASIADREKEG